MKPKLYLLALWLISGVLPLTLQGAGLMDKEGGPGGGPRIQRMSIPPVEVEIESGKVIISFIRDLGEVTVMLQEESSKAIVVYQTINATVYENEMYALPAGAYTLTVTGENEKIITGINLLIP